MDKRDRLNSSEICTQHIPVPPNPVQPTRNSIHVTSVYVCDDAEQAGHLLSQELPGFAYQRNGHPNEFVIGKRCAELHAADFGAVTSSGMAALSLALLSVLKQGDDVLVSSQLYGKTTELFVNQAAKFGITADTFDVSNTDELHNKFSENTRLVIAETISNPLMRIADIKAIAEIAHRHKALLLVDNTFASPVVCRPLELGADLVMESMTKIMNGHSDVLMGLLCGRNDLKSEVFQTQRTWGLVANPYECWLADRGLGTLELRISRACKSAACIAEELQKYPAVRSVHYPGLNNSIDKQIAERTLSPGNNGQVEYFGYMLSFELANRVQVDRFIKQSGFVFCPSLGDLSTTLSYPMTTSHLGINENQLKNMGICEGLLRISVGIETIDPLLASIKRGMAGLDD